MNSNYLKSLTAISACVATICSCETEQPQSEPTVPATVSITADAAATTLTRYNGTATFTLSKDDAGASQAASVKVNVDESYSPSAGEVLLPGADICYSIDIDEFLFTQKENNPKTGTVTFYVERIRQLASDNPSADFFVLPLVLTANDEKTLVDEENSSVVLRVTYNKPLPTLAITTDVTDGIVLSKGNLAMPFKVAYAQDSENSDLPASAGIEAVTEFSGMELLPADTYSVEPLEVALNGTDIQEVSGVVTFDFDKIYALWSGHELALGLKLTADNALIASDAETVVYTISGISELEALSFSLERMTLYANENYTATLAPDARFVSGNTYSYRISVTENGEAIEGLAPVTFDKAVSKFIINSYLTEELAKAANIAAGQKLWFVSEAMDANGTKDTKSYEFTYEPRDLKIALTAEMIANPLEFNSGKDGDSDMGSVAYLIDGNKMTKWQPANTYKDMSAEERKSKYGWDGTSPVCYPYYTKLSSEWFSKYSGAEKYDFTAGPNAGVWIDFTLPEGISSFQFGYQTNPNWWNGFPCGIRIYAKAAENDEWQQFGPAYAVPSQADGGRITSARNSDYTNAVKTLPAPVSGNSSTYAKTWTSDTITIEGNSVRYIRMLITETIDGGNQAKAEQPGWYNLKEHKPDGIWRTSGYGTCLSEVWLYGE